MALTVIQSGFQTVFFGDASPTVAPVINILDSIASIVAADQEPPPAVVVYGPTATVEPLPVRAISTGLPPLTRK